MIYLKIPLKDMQTNLFQLESTNPKNNSSPWMFFYVGGEAKAFTFTWKIQNVLKRMKNHNSDFYFSSYGNFFTQNMVNFRWIFTIIRKIKSGKIWNTIFLSFQHILHLSWKSNQFWGGGVCISIVGKYPMHFKITCYFKMFMH